MTVMVVAAVAGVLTTQAGSQPSGADAAALSGCYRNSGEKLVRVIGPDDSCRSYESQFGLGTPGPPGPPGPPGANGVSAFTVEPTAPVRLGRGINLDANRTDVAALRNLPPGLYLFEASLVADGDELFCRFHSEDIRRDRRLLSKLDEQRLANHEYDYTDAGRPTSNVRHSMTMVLRGSAHLGAGGEATLRCAGVDRVGGGSADADIEARSVRLSAIQVASLKRETRRGISEPQPRKGR